MSQKNNTKGLLGFFFCAVVLVLFDQWTKQLAVQHLKDQPAIVLIPGVFELRYLENKGAAFGMLQGHQTFFFIISLIVLFLVLFTLLRMPYIKRYAPLRICMLFLVSGAVGNMIDRFRHHFVVDFLYFRLINFPIFNVADCYVTVSAAVLFVLFMWYYKEEEISALFSKKGEIH